MLTPDERAERSVLSAVTDGCSCESYYAYTCSMCRAFSDGSVEPLVARGLVEFDASAETYHSQWRLTGEGKERLEALGRRSELDLAIVP